jgi:hypothetical protein
MAVAGLLLGGTALAASAPAAQAPATQPSPTEMQGKIDPQADAQLRRMSDYLAGLKSFRVDSTTIDEKVATDGQKIQELKESKLAVLRPNGLMVERTGPFGHGVFRYDGKQFSLFLPDKNKYATAPAPATLDEAIDTARDKLSIDAPGGDLIVSNPYRDLTNGVIEARYIGLEPVGNVMAHHIAVTEKDVDWQIWIQDGPQPVPLRYVITTKDMKVRPEFTIEMRNWQPNAKVDASELSFTPPAGATQIDLVPLRRSKTKP